MATERDHRGRSIVREMLASSYSCRFQLQPFVIQSPECLSSVSDLRANRIFTRQLQTSNNCISTPIENWTHVYTHMNLFTRNSPFYHLLKYLIFLLKHSVYKCVCVLYTYMYVCMCVCVCVYIYIYIY